jgi:pimeloyl-ACP methyl ester carboxylesterase
LFRLLNTRQFTSGRPRREKFVFELNAATKRPLQNNKRGTSSEQAGRGAHMLRQIKAPQGGIIAGSGHWIMEEQPAQTVSTVRAFLDGK